MTSVFSRQNSISLCPVSFCTPRPNLPVTPGVSWLPTFAFQSPIMKRTSFWGVSSRTLPLLKEKKNKNFLIICCCCCWVAQSVQLFVTPWTVARQASLFLTISQAFPKFMFIALVMPSIYLNLWCPLLLLPLIFPSIRVFSNELPVCIRGPKYWNYSFSISHSSEYSGLISLKIDCLDLLAVQGTFRSPLQHHSLKASIIWLSAFLMVQLSQPCVTSGKTIALTIQT